MSSRKASTPKVAPTDKAERIFRSPDNQFHTWNGRGRRPQWVKDQLAKGLTLEQLAVKEGVS